MPQKIIFKMTPQCQYDSPEMITPGSLDFPKVNTQESLDSPGLNMNALLIDYPVMNTDVYTKKFWLSGVFGTSIEIG